MAWKKSLVALVLLLSVADIQSLLVERSIVHGANPARVLSTAGCETGGTFLPTMIGSSGEVGLGQWLPGRGNHWDYTPAWRVWKIDIVREYRERGPEDDVVWLDADMLAWSFGPEANEIHPGNIRGWTCAG